MPTEKEQPLRDWTGMVLHPYLFAIFPVLLYFSLLYGIWVPVDQLLVPILFTLIATAVIHFASFLLLKNIRRAGIYTTLAFCIFYAPTFLAIVVRKGTDPNLLATLDVGAKPIVCSFWLLILFAVYRLLRSKSDFRQLTLWLNKVALFLVALELSIIVSQWFETNFLKYPLIAEGDDKLIESRKKSSAERPDFYYIILDKLARHEALSKVFHYDNTPFLQYLRDKGFYIANNSHCNYPRTLMSLASSLNMEYLDKVAKVYGPTTGDRTVLTPMIRKNALARHLQSLGYKFINISSYFGPTAWIPNADENIGNAPFDQFAIEFWQSTMMGMFTCSIDFLNDLYRDEKRTTFAHILQASKRAGPKFVFAHILLPHEPFYFLADGASGNQEMSFHGDQWTDATKRAYIEQTRYAEKQVESLIDQIIANSKSCPIIVLQSDHGTDATASMTTARPSDGLLAERYGILNAYLVPKQKRSLFYDSITPVNSFRTILKAYFGFALPLLADRSYYSPIPISYDYADVTPRLEQIETGKSTAIWYFERIFTKGKKVYYVRNDQGIE